MPFKNPVAAAELVRLRKAQGHSPESLADAVGDWARGKGPAWTRGSVDAYTIRRIEKHHFVPGPRVVLVLSTYFGRRYDEIWEPDHAVQVATRVLA